MYTRISDRKFFHQSECWIYNCIHHVHISLDYSVFMFRSNSSLVKAAWLLCMIVPTHTCICYQTFVIKHRIIRICINEFFLNIFFKFLLKSRDIKEKIIAWSRLPPRASYHHALPLGHVIKHDTRYERRETRYEKRPKNSTKCTKKW